MQDTKQSRNPRIRWHRQRPQRNHAAPQPRPMRRTIPKQPAGDFASTSAPAQPPEPQRQPLLPTWAKYALAAELAAFVGLATFYIGVHLAVAIMDILLALRFEDWPPPQ